MKTATREEGWLIKRLSWRVGQPRRSNEKGHTSSCPWESVRRRDEVDTRRESGTTPDLLLCVVAPEESERLTGFVPFFLNKKLKTFKDTFSICQGLHLVQKRALSLYIFSSSTTRVILSQGLSVFAPFSLEST